jgi:hypothetical protein
VFFGLGGAVAVAGQILGEKEAVDRGLPAGAADAVGRIERIESRLDFRDVGAAIAVAVDVTVGTGRVDRTASGDPNRQAGGVPKITLHQHNPDASIARLRFTPDEGWEVAA